MRLTAALTLSAVCFAVVLASGPRDFDHVDSTDMLNASRRLSIAHPPGYPLLLMSLRLFPGEGFLSGRIMTAMTAGLLAGLAFLVAGRATPAPAMASAAALLLVFFPSILLQLNTVEVYGPALALLLCAVAAGRSRIGPYLFGMAVFGGHPICLLAAPLAVTRAWRRTWPLALVPATLYLYIPLRAAASVNPHYTHPAGPAGLAAYMTLYSGRLGMPDPTGLLQVANPAFILPAAVLTALAALGRPGRREIAAALLSLIFFLCYRVPDPHAFLFPLVLALWFPAVRGMGRLALRGRAAGAAALSAAALSAVAGIHGAWRGGDHVAPALSRDMMRQVPLDAVYCTIGHDTFLACHLLEGLDMRPDVIPADLYHNYFSLMLSEPLPAVLSDRRLVATRAWSSPDLRLSGLLFRGDGVIPDWESMDFFLLEASSPDPQAMDAAAEAYARRAVQEEEPLRGEYAGLALESAATGLTRRRVEAILAP